MSRWFRYYSEALNDPKIQLMPPRLFKVWVNLLCVASENDGRLPSVHELTLLLRRRSDDVQAYLNDLSARGLVDVVGDHLEPHNWPERQYKSDTSTPRVTALRRKRNVSGNVTETAPDNRIQITDSSLRSEQAREKKSRRKPQTAVPEDWKSLDAARAYAKSQGLTDREIDREADRFVNHAKQSDRRCSDWLAAWRNWILKALEMLGRDPPKLLDLGSPSAGTWIDQNSEEWRSWTAHRGKPWPVDKRGGWHVPTRWPPGHAEAAA